MFNALCELCDPPARSTLDPLTGNNEEGNTLSDTSPTPSYYQWSAAAQTWTMVDESDIDSDSTEEDASDGLAESSSPGDSDTDETEAAESPVKSLRPTRASRPANSGVNSGEESQGSESDSM